MAATLRGFFRLSSPRLAKSLSLQYKKLPDMAVQIHQPRRSVNVVLRRFAMDATNALRENMQTQHVWPTEIYPGFAQVNEYRKQHNSWFATGRAAKSFYSKVDATPGKETITIGFIDYLRFVDMGVGAGRKAEDIDRARNARYDKRYIRRWLVMNGDSKTMRPAIMMETRHVASRMQNYFEDYYGRELLVIPYQTIEGLDPINIQL